MLILFALIGAGGGSDGGLLAQDGQRQETVTPGEESPWSWNVAVVGYSFPEVDFDDDPGDLQVTRSGVRLHLARRIDERRSLGFGWSYEDSRYGFGGGAVFGGPSGPLVPDPFDRVYHTRISATLQSKESEGFSWMTTVDAKMGAEPNADLGDGLTWGGGATATFRLFEGFLVTVGGFATTRLEDDPLVYPWLEVDWQPTERLNVGRQGSGVGVGYDWSDDVSWLDDLKTYVNLSFVERQYRLDDGPLLSDAVGRDDEFALNVGAIWTQGDLRFEVFGGAAIREITILSNDAEIGDAVTEPGPYFALGVTYGP